MRNIVSTIQREQNKIIRNLDDKVLVIQGVAGSGKTSIALHRIAYILYAFRDKIRSNEMLVLSPNKIFSDYISNVLPELGEANIREMNFDDLIRVELQNICKVEHRFDFIEYLIGVGDDVTARKTAVEYKSGVDFFYAMLNFLDGFAEKYVRFVDVNVEGLTVPADYIQKYFLKEYTHEKVPYFNRFNNIASFADSVEIKFGKVLGARIRAKLVGELKVNCLLKDSILEIYNDFLNELSASLGINLFDGNKSRLNYEDAFPLVYFKFELTGYSAFDRIKHVIVDEMQDYTDVQFEILKKIFPCNMTILGDINQVPIARDLSVLEMLSRVFDGAKLIRINNTYRSTAEITNFADKIIGLKDIVIFDRHGDEPEIKKCDSPSKEIAAIKNIVEQSIADGAKNLAIICKTEREAKRFYDKLIETYSENITLFNRDGTKFVGGLTVVPSYLAKGLEFDAVIIPEASDKNYCSQTDKQILYISCTRALHKLYLTYVGTLSRFLC